MREVSKNNLKKRIFTVASVVAAVCVCVGIALMVFNPTKAANSLPTEVIYGNNKYTKDDPLVVLEVVPHEAYDELGPITSNSAGTLTWDMIAAHAPKGKDNQAALKAYLEKYANKYHAYCNALINGNYVIGYKNTYNNSNEVYMDPWAEFSYNSSIIGYDVTNIKTVLMKKDLELIVDKEGNPILDTEGNKQYKDNGYKEVKELLDMDTDIRNFFSIMVFGDTDMEDKIKLVVKKASDVTKEDIDNSDLVYINGKSHNTSIVNLYNSFYTDVLGIASNVDSSHTVWELGGNDLSAEVAMYLQMKSVVDRKAVIVGSTDKNIDGRGNYSNIARFALLQTAIDADVFISDFAYSEEEVGRKYKGLYGDFRIDNTTKVNGKNVETIEVYLDIETYYTDRGLSYEGNPGTKKLPFSATMFINDSVIDNKYGYAPNGNNVGSKYPVYNATTINQDFLTNSTFVFNSNNALTNSFANAEGYKSDYDGDGNYLGSSYGDAVFKLELEKNSDLVTPGIIKYILGAFGGGPDIIEDVDGDGIADIRVLEIEPAGTYRYFDTSYDDKELICKIFGLYVDNLLIVDKTTEGVDATGKVKVDIKIDHMSMNAFNGYTGDIRAEYDLVVLGAYDKDDINNNDVSSRYNTDSTDDKDDRIYNNDLTDKAYDKIYAYLDASMPMVIEADIYNRQDKAAAKNTNVYKLNNMALSKEFGSVLNVVVINTKTPSKDQMISRRVKYIVKPGVTVAPDGIDNYNANSFTASMLVAKDKLPQMVFKGRVSNASVFRMKIYVDRDCDSLFNEDYSSEDAELVFYGVDKMSRPVTDMKDNVLGVLFGDEAADEGANVSIDEKDTGIVSSPVKDEDGKIIGWDVEIKCPLPEALNGYMGWKVEVIDEDSGRVNINTGAFAVKNPVKKTVKVLQIGNSKDETGKLLSNIDLSKGSAFDKLFDGVSDVTNLDLEVTSITKAEFNEIKDEKVSELQAKKNYLDNFSMLVMGLSDNYGKDAVLSPDSRNAIAYYIDNGNSVLFTHDSLYYKNEADKEGLNAFTAQFKPIIGMKDGYSLTEPLRMKLDGKYSLFNSVNPSGTTRDTDKVTKLNKGEITEYPYTIDETITVATTHAQYFKLDLEDLKNPDGTDKDDVVVWYTLSATDTPGGPKEKSDTYKDLSKFYQATGQDAVNNYYVYSMGNITYSSAGHSPIGTSQTSELKLFVNTFIRAILSGNSKPEIAYGNAVQESEHLYTKAIRNVYKGDTVALPAGYAYDDLLEATISFKITDPDLVSGAQINQAFMFYDRNGNGVYDENEDINICWIGVDASDKKIARFTPYEAANKPAKSVMSGYMYGGTHELDLWSILDDGEIDNSIQFEMANKLIRNELKIGIVAKDSKNATGFGVVQFVERKLHKLD